MYKVFHFDVVQSSVSVFPSVAYAFDVVSEKPFPNPRSCGFLHVCTLKGFIILVLTFRSSVHLELICECGVR